MSDIFNDFFLNSAPASVNDPVAQTLEALAQDDLYQAVAGIEEVKTLEGETSLVRHLLSLAMLRTRRLAPAFRLAVQAHEDTPQGFEFAELSAVCAALLGLRTEALYYAKLATSLKPEFPQYDLIPSWLVRFNDALLKAEESPLVDAAIADISRGYYSRAVESLTDALSLDKTNVRAWHNLIKASLLRRRPGEALAAADALRDLAGDDPEALQDHAMAAKACGLIATAWQDVRAAVSASGGDPDHVQRMISLSYSVDDPAQLPPYNDLVGAWLALSDPKPSAVSPMPWNQQSGRLRIGVICGEVSLETQKVGLLSTLNACTQRGALLHYYVNQEVEDSVSRGFRKNATRWRQIAEVDDQTVAQIIRNDQIQVLIDLDGFDRAGRPGLFALAPAPVVCAVGAPADGVPFARTSSSAVVRSLWDASMAEDALEIAKRFPDDLEFVEHGLSSWPLFLVPDGDSAADIDMRSPLHVLVSAPSSRVSDLMLACLAKVQASGASITWRGDDLVDDALTEILEKRSAAVGLDLERIARVAPDADDGPLFQACDLLIDTFPVPSVDAVFTALKSSRPVLTVAPDCPVNYAGGGILTALGLGDWICAGADELVERLTGLAADPRSARIARETVSHAVANASDAKASVERADALMGQLGVLLAKVVAK